MRAALLESNQKPLSVVTDIECAAPGAGEVLVKVSSCGICHSDLSVIDAEGGLPLPMVLGHEAAGVVEEVGVGVTRLAKGDRVMLTPMGSCGHCYYCVRNQPTLCIETANYMAGVRADGTTPLSRGADPRLPGLPARRLWRIQRRAGE